MKKISILFLSVLLFICPVMANLYDYPTNLENVFQTVPKLTNIKCKFKQEKHLQNILKPVISTGDFEFSENKGVIFKTTYPIKSTVDYTNKNYKQINDVIIALSNKKYSNIEKEFQFYLEHNSKSWTLGMTPKKNSSTYGYISSITIIGTDYIRQISINQTNGNKTVIWFTK